MYNYKNKMLYIHLAKPNGRKNLVSVNEEITVRGIINKYKNEHPNVDVNALVFKGQIVNGNKKIKNFKQTERSFQIVKAYSKNVKRVTELLSQEYIQKLKKLPNKSITNEQLKTIVKNNLAHMVDNYLISALRNM